MSALLPLLPLLPLLLLLAPAHAHAGPLDDLVERIRGIRSQRLGPDAPDIPAAAYHKALSGQMVTGVEFVDGAKAGKGWGVAVFDQPVEDVWRVVNDEERQVGRIPVDASVIIAGERHQTGRTLFQYMRLPVVTDRWWVVDVTHNGPLYEASGGTFWEQRWTEVADPQRAIDGTRFADLAGRGMPVDTAKGAWLLVRLDDGRTLSEYFTWSDPGGQVPAGLASRFAGGAIKEMFIAVEALAAEQQHEAHAKPFVRPDGAPMR